MADKDPIIVAIELGTSRICGIAGKKKDGNLQILAYAEEKAIGCMKRGLVFNIEKTTQCIKNVIAKLESSLKLEISQVYVGLGGQSLRSVRSKIRRNLVTPSYITAEHIDSMRNESREISIPDYELLENVPQGYNIDGNIVDDPVGVTGTNLEGDFVNVVARRKLRGNIENCFNNTHVKIVDTRISAFELAKSVLTDQEKRAGSVLVDLGAGTTSVVVYRNNILRHLVTLPIGMGNITQDLMTLQMDQPEAERVKIQYGNACLDDANEKDKGKDKAGADSEPQPTEEIYETQLGSKVKVADIQHYIYARLTEILVNVKNQINNSGFDTQLLGGIILTGGGSHMKNIEEAFRNLNLKVDKVRVAHAINEQVIKNSNVTRLNYDAGEGLSLVALLSSGSIDCVGEKANEPDMFKETEHQAEVQKRQAEQQQQEKVESEASQKMETYKNALRAKIQAVNNATSELAAKLGNKDLRKQLEGLVDGANGALDAGYNECRATLEQKDKFKQTLHETDELIATLETACNTARDTVRESKKETNVFSKIMRGLNGIVNED